jgi:DNA polymerase-3 subunit chi
MTRVDFAFNADARVSQAARSTLKQVARGVRLFVYCDEPERMSAFDQALWTTDDIGFVPHERLSEESSDELLVYLVDQANWPLLVARVTAHDWLVNLDDSCPPEVTLFTRVLEIVSQEASDRQGARARWRQYQAMGLDVRAHQLTPSASDP